MIVVIERPCEGQPDYCAWTADCPNGVIAGIGSTIEGVKADFKNSITEMRDAIDTKEWREYLSETPRFYLEID